MLVFALIICCAFATSQNNCPTCTVTYGDDDIDWCSKEHQIEVLDELIEGFVCGKKEFDLTEVDDDVMKLMKLVGDPFADDPNFKEIVCFNAGEVIGSKMCDQFDWGQYEYDVREYLQCYGMTDDEKDDAIGFLKDMIGMGRRRKRKRRRRRR